MLNAESWVIYIAPTRRRILGYSDAELVGRSIFELLHPDDLRNAQDAFKTLMTDPSHVITIQARVRHQDGNWRWLEGTGSNCLAHPSMRGIVVNFHDITEAKVAEAALRKSHDELEEGIVERTRELTAVNTLLKDSEERFRLF